VVPVYSPFYASFYIYIYIYLCYADGKFIHFHHGPLVQQVAITYSMLNKLTAGLSENNRVSVDYFAAIILLQQEAIYRHNYS
jgi:hypothetical protein